MILKFLNYQIFYRYKTAYLWKIALKKKFPTHLSTTFKNQGLNISIERAPHLKNVLLYQKWAYIFTEKNRSNINALNDTWNKYQKQFKIDLLNRRRQDVKKLLTESFLKSHSTFQHTILSSPSLSFTLLLFHFSVALSLSLILNPPLT